MCVIHHISFSVDTMIELIAARLGTLFRPLCPFSAAASVQQKMLSVDAFPEISSSQCDLNISLPRRWCIRICRRRRSPSAGCVRVHRLGSRPVDSIFQFDWEPITKAIYQHCALSVCVALDASRIWRCSSTPTTSARTFPPFVVNLQALRAPSPSPALIPPLRSVIYSMA